MVIELNNLVESSLGCSLRSRQIFDYPTVEALVDYLAKEVFSPEPSESFKAGLPQNEKLEALFYSLI